MVHTDSSDSADDGQEALAWQQQVLRLEAAGTVTRTFRRLDPDRQRAVIEALIGEAAEHGAQGVQVKRAAARAGVSVGSLYQYFPRRDGMLEAAVQVAASYLTASLDGYRGLLAQLPLRAGLTAYLAGGVAWSQQQTGLLCFFARAAYAGVPGYGESLIRPVARSMRDLLRALIDAAAARGELRPGLDPAAATRLVQALTSIAGDTELLPHLNDYYLLQDPGRPAEQVREEVVDFVLHAIGRQDR